jgi:hypothetical protein
MQVNGGEEEWVKKAISPGGGGLEKRIWADGLNGRKGKPDNSDYFVQREKNGKRMADGDADQGKTLEEWKGNESVQVREEASGTETTTERPSSRAALRAVITLL